jgi:AcrR family transcriptional regulator
LLKPLALGNRWRATTVVDVAKAGPKQPAQGGDDVKARLVDATVRVLARDGFAHASARAIATEAGGVNGLIFYHFGSMDHLLAATARTLTERGIDRIRQGLGGDRADTEWPTRLGDVIRSEAIGDDGRAVMELLVGSRTSPVLAGEVRSAIDHALEFATAQLKRVLADSPLGQVVPVTLLAELAGATFLGLEVLTHSGREIDIARLASHVALGLGAVAAALTPR